MQPSTQFVPIPSSPKRSPSPPNSGKTIAIASFAVVIFLLFMLYKPDIGEIIDNIARHMPSSNANESPNGTVAVKRVNTVCLNLRTEPGVHSQVIMRLPQGTYVALRNESRTVGSDVWVKVLVDHRKGWVNQRHLEQRQMRIPDSDVARMTGVRGSCP